MAESSMLNLRNKSSSRKDLILLEETGAAPLSPSVLPLIRTVSRLQSLQGRPHSTELDLQSDSSMACSDESSDTGRRGGILSCFKCIKSPKVQPQHPQNTHRSHSHYGRICRILKHLSTEVEFDSDLPSDVALVELTAGALLGRGMMYVEDVDWMVTS